MTETFSLNSDNDEKYFKRMSNANSELRTAAKNGMTSMKLADDDEFDKIDWNVAVSDLKPGENLGFFCCIGLT